MLRLACAVRDISISLTIENHQVSIPELDLHPGDVPFEKTCDPLRILFFGTDAFSVTCLEALHKHRRQLGIDSIDVLTKTPRRTGRGRKKFNSAPIRATAEELSIPLHEISGFEPGWSPPKHDGQSINLLIAVSFGLLIPGNIIKSTKYGGLNVHPSPLPDLRGAAPIYHALLQRRKYTQVSVQTLHPTKFDYGFVVARSDDVELPDDYENIWQTPVATLRNMLSPVGAEVLVRTLYKRLFIPPLQECKKKDDVYGPQAAAPKITKNDSCIDWANWSASDISWRGRVLGELWSTLKYPGKDEGGSVSGTEIRVKFHRLEHVNDPKTGGLEMAPGKIKIIDQGEREALAVRAAHGTLLIVREMTLAGKDRGIDPVESLRRLCQTENAAFSLTEDMEFH